MRQYQTFTLIFTILLLSGCLSPELQPPEIVPWSSVKVAEVNNLLLEERWGESLVIISGLKSQTQQLTAQEINMLRQQQERAEQLLIDHFYAYCRQKNWSKALSLYRSAMAASIDRDRLTPWNEAGLILQYARFEADNGNYISALTLFISIVDHYKDNITVVEQFYTMAIENQDIASARILEPLAKNLSVSDHLFKQLSNTFQADTTSSKIVTILVNKGFLVEKGIAFPNITLGSGFFIQSDGYIVTNYHVIESEVDPDYEGFSRLYVRLPEQEEQIPARVVAWDPVLDTALLKVDLDNRQNYSIAFNNRMPVGSQVYAIGAPIGLENSVTAGIISSITRDSIMQIGEALQVDVAINEGNSGGPLIAANNEVAGVVFAGIEPYEGLNFAIPASWLRAQIPKLFATGKVVYSWLGAVAQKEGKDAGVVLRYLYPNGPLSRLGLQPRDRLLTVAEKPINSLSELQMRLLNYPPDSLVNVGWRTVQGEERQGLLLMEQRPDIPMEQALSIDSRQNMSAALFGMLLHKNNQYGSDGFVIEHVFPATVADIRGFSSGDPISIRHWIQAEETPLLLMQVIVKRKKAGFVEVPIELIAYLILNNCI